MQGYYYREFGCDRGVFAGGGVFRCPSGLSCYHRIFFFRFETPSLLGSGTVCVTFWYHAFGTDIGRLLVYRSSLGQSQPLVPEITTNQGNVWRQASATIFNFQSGERVLKLEFLIFITYYSKILVVIFLKCS